MKRLLIITDLYPDKYRPFSEVFVQHQVKELSKTYEVMVLATRVKHKYSIEHVKYQSYQVTYVYIPYIKYVDLSLLFTYKLIAISCISRMIKDWKPDIIHVHDFRHIPELFILQHCLNQFKIPRYLSVHNVRTHPNMVRSTFFKWFYRLSFRSSYSGWKHIFTVNDRLKSIISQDARVSNVINIGNAIGPIPEIPTKNLEPIINVLNEDSYKIITVGNLFKEKGFDLLIKAVSILIKKDFLIQLCIIGKGSEIRALKQEINDLGLEKCIFLAGGIDNDVVRNLYEYFDAFVLASYSETFGIVYIEAMYSGLPTVGVLGQGIDGIIKSGVNGLLVKPRDVGDLADKIEYLMTNRNSAKEIASNGQRMVKTEYLLPQLIEKIVKVYEQ